MVDSILPVDPFTLKNQEQVDLIPTPTPMYPAVDASIPLVPTPSVLETKKQNVADASRAKKMLLGGSQNADVVATALQEGNDLANTDQAVLDAASLPPLEFQRKYGADAGEVQNRLTTALNRVDGNNNQSRDLTQITGDTLNSITQGALNSAGGLVALPAGLVSDRAGNAISNALGSATEALQGVQSDELNRIRRSDAIAAQLDSADNRERYERDLVEDGSVVAGLKRVGRDFGDAVERTVSNPTILGDTVAQGVGSLAVAGPASKAIRAAGSGLTKVLGNVGKEVVDAASTPAAIGLMEGGGAYSQASQEVMNMSHAQLNETSPYYREQIANGVSPEDARIAAANRAGLIAGAIQTPIGAATGTLVSRFEANPLALNSARTAVGNVAREAVEETIQSGAGQLASNVGIQQAADENRSALDEVGSSAAIGGLAGAGSAGVVQTPSTILRGAADAVKGAIGSIEQRGKDVKEANRKASPVAAETINESVEQAVNQIPAVAQGLYQNAKVENQEQADELTNFVNRIVRTAQITPEEIQRIPESVRSLVPESDNRFEVILAAASIAANQENTPDDRITAGLFVRRQLLENESVFNADLPSALKGMAEDNPEREQFTNYKRVLDSINQHPAIREVFDVLNEIEALPETQEITPRVVDDSIDMAAVNPSAVNPETADRILNQADIGTVNLSPEQRASIQAASSLVRAGRQYAMDLQEMGQPIAEAPSMKQVNQQIERASSDPQKLSLNQHMSGIIGAYQSGDTKLSRTRAQRLALFAKHMGNKVAALNKSFETGQPQTYQSIDPAGKWFESKSPLMVRPNNQGSVKFAQQVFAEANYAATLANNVASIFPELGLRPVAVPSLVPALKRPVTLQEQQVRSTREIPENRTQEADNRVVEEPVAKVQDAIPEAPVVETETVVEPIQEEVVSESTPVVSEVREETQPEATQEVEEPVQRNEQETTERLPSESGREIVNETTVTVDSQYPNLIQIGETENWFKQAFKFPSEMTSRLVGQATPIEFLRNALASETTLSDTVGSDLRYSFDKPIARAYRRYLELAGPVIGMMNNRLRKVLTQKKTTKDGIEYTLLNNILEGRDVTSWLRGRAFNILDMGKTSVKYNQELLGQAVAAGLHWALNAQSTAYPIDKSEIARIIGIEEADVDDPMEEQFNRGLSVTEAKRSLASEIQKFWGVTADKNTPMGYTKGIPESVAAEILYGLENAGLIKFNELKVPVFDPVSGQVKNKLYPRVWFDKKARSEEINDLMNILEISPEAIVDATLIENDEKLHIGTPPASVAQMQMRNPLVQNTRQQKAAIKAAQETPFYLNEMMYNLYNSMGEKSVVEFFGGMDLSNVVLNENYKRSIEGKNRGLQNSFLNLMKQVKQLESYGSREAPVFYEHNMSRVGRLHMQGASNPQSDKMAREMFMSTKTVLDLTNEADSDKFWMTIAQALGVKTEKLTRSDAVAKAQVSALEFESFMPAVREFIQDGTPLSKGTLSDIKEKLGKNLTFKAMHAILSIAKLKSTEDLTNFEHFLSLEADGKTDGPINALVHFSAGSFSDAWLTNVGKGGLYFGERNKTLNAHSNIDKADLYETAKGKLETEVASFRALLRDSDSEAVALSESLLKVMNALSADVTFDPDSGKLELSRGVTKNPLTITIYGSGINGIAGKVASGLVDELYKQISDVMNQQGEITPELEADLENLLNNRVIYKKSEAEYQVIKEGNFKISGDPAKFTIPTKQLQTLRHNVKIMFVNQMHKAITDMMEGAMGTTKKVQQAIQVQSIALKHIFQAEVNARLAESGRKKHEFLTENELGQIYKDLKQYSPIIETGTQSFFVGGTERNDVVGTSFSASITEDLTSDAYVFGPVNAGVGGAPYMVIGTGDGQMVQNILTAKNRPEGALMVFDGVEMKASTIDEDSRKINEAVFDGWMGNPVRNVADSFTAFLREGPFSVLTGSEQEAMELEIKQALYGPKASDFSFDDAMATIADLNSNLVTDANSIQARHETMEAIELSVDHMASAEAPYTNDGEKLPADRNALLDRVNQIYSEKLARISKTEPAIQKADEKFSSLGQVDSDTGVRVLGTNELKGLSTNDIFIAAVDALDGQGYTVVIGSPAEISAYEQNVDPQGYKPEFLQYGKINHTKKMIYIANASEETILHELIHASTLDKVVDYYENHDRLSDQDVEALDRLEGLMQEWVSQNYDSDIRPAQEAHQQAFATVSSYLNQGKDAEALNEFMAWSLSNQHIAEVQKKTKVKNPIFRILGEALKVLKKLIGINVDDTLFSNIRFNTRVLLSTPAVNRDDVTGITLFQHGTLGTNTRLTDLRQQFFNKIQANITQFSNPVKRISKGSAARLAMAQADNVALEFISRGFPMDMQEASTFQMIHAAMSTDITLNPSTMNRIQDLYTHVIKNLSVESFMSDPQSQDPNERYVAQEKFNVLNGVYIQKMDAQGRSNLLSSFLALSMVDDGFRSILAKMELPKSERAANDSTDNVLDNIGTEAMDRLSVLMSGQKGSDVKEALDALTERLVTVEDDNRTFIEQLSEKTIGGFDMWVSDKLQQLSAETATKAKNVADNTNNKFVKASAQAVRLVSNIINNDTAESIASGITSGMNRSGFWTPIRELTSEIIGRTSENASVFDMISLVRSAVQQTRQQFREHLPEKIVGHFSRPLSEEVWSHLYRGIGKTDLASLVDGNNFDTVLSLLTDNKALAIATSKIESDLQLSEGPLFKNIKRKSHELADFLVSGVAGPNLLRNAFAIANLYGAGGRKSAASEQTIKNIDHLVSLYALQALPAEVKATLSSLVQTEKEGMNFALAYLVGQRFDEQAKVTTPIARINHFKGYIPSENKVGTSFVIADDREFERLVNLGYTRVADYGGSEAEGRGTKRGYYHSPVSGRAAFNQGVMQNVKTTASGIDPDTGRTIDITAGAITDPDEIKRIIKRMGKNQGDESLMPVWNEAGDVIAFERSLDPKKLSIMDRNTNLAEMIGAWRGRQVEEELASDFNKQLVDNLYKIWNEQKGSRADEFIDLTKLVRSDDPVIFDAWALAPAQLRDYVQGVFGGEGFRVRKDMINDAIGYRSASVTDVWTGNTRWKPAVTQRVHDTAVGIFGNKAFTYMAHAEKFTQNAVASAKVLIVVKSVIVPVANIISNMYQLMGRGVPLRSVLQGSAAKTTEINQYMKNRERQIELEADLRASGGNLVKERRIKTELQAIEDANKRMSIYDLVQAGEFSSISEGLTTPEDHALFQGKFVDFVEKQVDRLPEGVKTLGRYALVTKDTALFKGLARAVQYGDFIAKAVLYDDLRKRQGLKKEDALAQVSEEFVNYNRLAGRTRQYLESIGLLWFWNFKLRSMKVAASMISNNPVRALMSAVATPSLPIIGSIGSPVTDNFLSVMADGKLDYSVGPGMGLNSYSLNPWMNLFK